MAEATTSGPAPDERASPGGPVALVPGEGPALIRLFGSRAFFRLWVAGAISSLGDWIGLVAVISVAARVGRSSPEAAVGVVLAARVVPGLFLGSVGGVLVDRLDRKRVMVACDLGRAVVLAFLPFVDTVWGLFLASLLLEVLTLLWSPAKEASVPNLVRAQQLSTANSLSLAAAYGTFPLGSALFAALAKVAEFLGHIDALRGLRINQESVAIYFDVATFVVSAALISRLELSRRDGARGGRIDLARTFTDLRDGWRFIGTNPVVRAVLVGIGTGLLGGGMVVPLGPTFSKEVLRGGPAGFGLLLTALGTGTALGVVSLSALQRRLPRHRIFSGAVLGGGAFMLAGASMSSMLPALAFVTALGLCAGAVYVVGFTLLQENVGDEMRGRVFATLYTMVRFVLLAAMLLAPLLAGALDGLSNRAFGKHAVVLGLDVALPGTRLTLWLGGLLVVAAGVLATLTLRRWPGGEHHR